VRSRAELDQVTVSWGTGNEWRGDVLACFKIQVIWWACKSDGVMKKGRLAGDMFLVRNVFGVNMNTDTLSYARTGNSSPHWASSNNRHKNVRISERHMLQQAFNHDCNVIRTLIYITLRVMQLIFLFTQPLLLWCMKKRSIIHSWPYPVARTRSAFWHIRAVCVHFRSSTKLI
jgi:hypothetical protein